MSGRFQPLYDETAPAIVPPPEPNALAPPPTWADAATLAGQEIQRQRAISEQRKLWDQGGMTSAGVRDAATQLTNMLATSTSAPGFRAYHGSPHSFERFDTSKIGTGEGAQAYGHGLYVAESENVAKSYRDQLSRTDYDTTAGGRIPDWIGNRISNHAVGSDPYKAEIDTHLTDFRTRLAETQKELATSAQPWLAQDRVANLTKIIGDMEQLKSGEATLKPRGSMYEVNVAADPAHFLDWDKPLSQQGPLVQDKIRNLQVRGMLPRGYTAEDMDTLTGGDLLRDLIHKSGSHANSAALLAEPVPGTGQGIPGIRYLDAGSRASGGTSNHVIFDANTIEILRKYGIAGLLAGGTAAATASQQEPPT